MLHSMSRRRFMFLGVLGLAEMTVVGCGTVLHPERKGQPAGKMDWSVVALDGIGLLFFFVPGVIAFAVDFNNGTIYLPADEEPAPAVTRHRGAEKLVPISTSQRRLTPAAIERAVARQTGREIRLIPGAYQTKELEHLDQFWMIREEFKVG